MRFSPAFMDELNRTRRSLLLSGAIASGASLSGCLRLIGGGGTPTSTQTQTIVEGAPLAEFAFEYTENGGSGNGSLKIRHDGGDPIRAENLQIRSSEGETATWNILGSTTESASQPVRQGHTARIDATVVNWPTDVRPTESIKIIFLGEDGSPTTLDTFSAVQTETTEGESETSQTNRDEKSIVIEDFEDGDPTGWELAPQGWKDPDSEGTQASEWTSTTETVARGNRAGKLATDGGRDKVEFTLNNPIQPTQISFWARFEGNLNTQDACRLHLRDTNGNTISGVSFDGSQAAEQVIYSNSRVVPMQGSEIKGRWFRFIIKSIDWNTQTFDLKITDINDNELHSNTDLGFRDPGIQSFGNVRIANRNNRSTAPFYVDEIETKSSTSKQADDHSGLKGWPMFQFDIQNTGYAPGKSAPNKEFSVRWKFDTGGIVAGGPVIGEGQIFIHTQAANRSVDRTLYALDVQSGELNWKHDMVAPQGNHSSGGAPAIFDGKVFNGSRDHKMYALSTKDGSKLWSYETGAGIISSPNVQNSTVYFGGRDGNAYALDANTGEEEWVTDLGGTNVNATPAVHNGSVFIGNDSFLFSLDSASGEKQWQFPENDAKLGGSVHNVTAYESLIYFGIGPVGNTNKDNSLFAIHQDSGELAWNALKTGTQPGVAAMNGMVFGGANKGNQYGVYAFEADSGRELWHYSIGKTNSPIALDGTVYASTRDGNLLAIDPSSGELKSQFELDSAALRAPAVAEQAVFVGDKSGKLYSLE